MLFIYIFCLHSYLGQVLSYGGLGKSYFVHIYKKGNTNLCDRKIKKGMKTCGYHSINDKDKTGV